MIGRFRVTDDPLGWESAVAIAVESTPARQNFSMLAQDSLETRRGDSDDISSPLLRLLESAMFGPRRRLGSENVNPETFAVKLVTWRTQQAAK